MGVLQLQKNKEEVTKSAWFQVEMAFSQCLPYLELGRAFKTLRKPKDKMEQPKSSLTLFVSLFLPEPVAS